MNVTVIDSTNCNINLLKLVLLLPQVFNLKYNSKNSQQLTSVAYHSPMSAKSEFPACGR